MKLRKSLAINVFLAIFAMAAAVHADWSPAEEKPAQNANRGGRVEILTKELELTDEQQRKMKDVYEARDKRLQTLYAEFREKRSAILDDSNEKVRAILTAEQREKLKKMQEKRLAGRAKIMGKKDRRQP